MKKGTFFGFNLLLAFLLFASSTFAQNSPQWHLPKGAKARLGKGGITDIAYSPDGNLLAVGTTIGIWIYDVHSGAELTLLTGHTAPIESVAFSPDGNTLASGGSWGDETIRLWDVATWQPKVALTGHKGSIDCVVFSPDRHPARKWGFRQSGAAVGCTDRAARSQACSAIYVGSVVSRSVRMARRSQAAEVGTTTQCCCGIQPRCCRMQSQETRKPLLKDMRAGSKVWHSVRMARCSQAGDGDNTVHLWDVRTGQLIATLEGHTGSVNNLAFSPDGTTLASGSSDETIRLWHTPGDL